MSQPHFFVDIVDDPIDLHGPAQVPEHFLEGDDSESADTESIGAHGWFYGVTRRTTGDKVTQTLSYEAHHSMAIKELANLCTQAIEKFHLHRAVIVHRVGEVPVGHASVVVGCSGSHRVEVFAAMPWIMDHLKQDVPIWKRETFANGDQQWIHPEEGGA